MGAIFVPDQSENTSILRRILTALMYPAWVDRSQNRLRVENNNIGGTVTTVSNVTTVAQFGGFDTLAISRSITIQTWTQAVRPRIT